MLNVFSLAMPIIKGVSEDNGFLYRTFKGTSDTDYGTIETKYTAWKTGDGIVQPTEASVMDVSGIRPANHDINVWTQLDLNTTDANEVCDQVKYKGKVYNIMSSSDWLGHNGWKSYTCSEDKSGSTWS